MFDASQRETKPRGKTKNIRTIAPTEVGLGIINALAPYAEALWHAAHVEFDGPNERAIKAREHAIWAEILVRSKAATNPVDLAIAYRVLSDGEAGDPDYPEQQVAVRLCAAILKLAGIDDEASLDIDSIWRARGWPTEAGPIGAERSAIPARLQEAGHSA